MKDFKSYSNRNDNTQNGGGNAADGNLNSTLDLANMVSRAMSGKNERQILSTIIAEAERGKRAGTLTNDDLDRFYNTLLPMLDGAKKRKLKEVIDRLKQI